VAHDLWIRKDLEGSGSGQILRYYPGSCLDLGSRWGCVVNVTLQPRFTPGETTSSILWIGGWVGLRAGLDTEARGKIFLCRGSNTGLPVCSQPILTELPRLLNRCYKMRMYSGMVQCSMASFTFLAAGGTIVGALCQVSPLGEGRKRGGRIVRTSPTVKPHHVLNLYVWGTLPGSFHN
jgi:hypothetical protein